MATSWLGFSPWYKHTYSYMRCAWYPISYRVRSRVHSITGYDTVSLAVSTIRATDGAAARLEKQNVPARLAKGTTTYARYRPAARRGGADVARYPQTMI